MKDTIICGDCLEVMKDIHNESVDMILCDLPYGTTGCKWDVVIPFEPLWEQYNRVIKGNGAIILFGSEPFSSVLRMSNIANYKYDWIWNKKLAGNGILAKKQPLKIHENISVFNGKYNPQMTKGKLRKKLTGNLKISEINGGDGTQKCTETYNDEYYPTSILEFSIANRLGRLHPTQKSLALCEYLIRTYSNENDIILDNCIGSGTTALACVKTMRHYIGIEINQGYVEIANKRLREEVPLFI